MKDKRGVRRPAQPVGPPVGPTPTPIEQSPVGLFNRLDISPPPEGYGLVIVVLRRPYSFELVPVPLLFSREVLVDMELDAAARFMLRELRTEMRAKGLT